MKITNKNSAPIDGLKPDYLSCNDQAETLVKSIEKSTDHPKSIHDLLELVTPVPAIH